MTNLERVCGALDASAISHALIGAAALAARGVARSTYDVDLLTADDRVLATVVWSPLTIAGLLVEIRKGDADDPLGGVVRIEAASERPIDVILARHAWQRRAVERAEQIAGGPPIVLARDLVLLKLYAGGPQDLWDIAELVRHPQAGSLVAEVTADVAQLSSEMQERWARFSDSG